MQKAGQLLSLTDLTVKEMATVDAGVSPAHYRSVPKG